MPTYYNIVIYMLNNVLIVYTLSGKLNSFCSVTSKHLNI